MACIKSHQSKIEEGRNLRKNLQNRGFLPQHQMDLKRVLLYKALDLFEEIAFFFMKLFGCSKEADHFEPLIACFFMFRIAFQLVRLAVCLLKFIRISGFDLSLLLFDY